MFSKGILCIKSPNYSPLHLFTFFQRRFFLSVFFIIFSLLSASSFARSGIKVDFFKDISSCKYSPRGSSLGFDCNTIAASAAKLSDSLVWPFKTVNECYKHYGLDNCYANKDGYLSVQPSGFAFIHKGNGIAFPVFESISLGRSRIVLPNGYEIEKGTSRLPSFVGNQQLVNMSKAKSLEKNICVSFSQGRNCDSIANLLNLSSSFRHDVLYAIANSQ